MGLAKEREMEVATKVAMEWEMEVAKEGEMEVATDRAADRRQ